LGNLVEDVTIRKENVIMGGGMNFVLR
jgi:hypothetical protein